ncbi:MAG: hypothetical protein HOO93_00800 [Methyloglobulus sp.]|nr:hypothetical protein [Methyloglobulus sp.]
MSDNNPLDEGGSEDAALLEKLADALIPGFQAEFDPEEAEQVGAFQEDALSEQDALDSAVDSVTVDHE